MRWLHLFIYCSWWWLRTENLSMNEQYLAAASRAERAATTTAAAEHSQQQPAAEQQKWHCTYIDNRGLLPSLHIKVVLTYKIEMDHSLGSTLDNNLDLWPTYCTYMNRHSSRLIMDDADSSISSSRASSTFTYLWTAMCYSLDYLHKYETLP